MNNLIVVNNENLAEAFERRLNHGYEMIEQALASGKDVSALEEYWVKLLHEYEASFSHAPLAA